MRNFSPHNFHIPVMGLAYTIDSPIKVAKYGITSAISIIEDNLVEMMRKYYYSQICEDYKPITTKEIDYRANRITDYLNLINRIVNEQVEILKEGVFEKGADINKYFELLPDDNELKKIYKKIDASRSAAEKREMENYLRSEIIPGSIEVNIMTKLDKNNHDKSGCLIEDGSDALSALRGYAKSNLVNSSIIFSAGLNPRLFNYMEKFTEFDAKGWGEFDKKVIIKVSDYRSALIQGKYLAKKGIWVSEFRVESGLNCGGHAFATDGILLGPILEEFKNKREELAQNLLEVYNPVVRSKGKIVYDIPHPIKITVQGGIGIYDEAVFLLDYYNMDSTGWGTPFLLCPEATTVDHETLNLLSEAAEQDVVLSRNSPLGVRFNYLKGTSGELEKLNKYNRGTAGSPCTEKYLVSNTEFTTEPICTASTKYQKLKIEQLKALNLSEYEFEKQVTDVIDKECLCVGLSNAAAIHYNLPFIKKQKAVTICPGPNIAYFSKIVTLQEMVDHIYGRNNIIEGTTRPHMFIKELQLYLAYFKEQLLENKSSDAKFRKYCAAFSNNILEGISYYRELIKSNSKFILLKDLIEVQLDEAETELNQITQEQNLITA